MIRCSVFYGEVAAKVPLNKQAQTQCGKMKVPAGGSMSCMIYGLPKNTGYKVLMGLHTNEKEFLFIAWVAQVETQYGLCCLKCSTPRLPNHPTQKATKARLCSCVVHS